MLSTKRLRKLFPTDLTNIDAKKNQRLWTEANLHTNWPAFGEKRWNQWKKRSFIISVCLRSIFLAFRLPKLNNWVRIMVHKKRMKSGSPQKTQSSFLVFQWCWKWIKRKFDQILFWWKEVLNGMVRKCHEEYLRPIKKRHFVGHYFFSVLWPHSSSVASMRLFRSFFLIIARFVRLVKHLWH